MDDTLTNGYQCPVVTIFNVKMGWIMIIENMVMMIP